MWDDEIDYFEKQSGKVEDERLNLAKQLGIDIGFYHGVLFSSNLLKSLKTLLDTGLLDGIMPELSRDFENFLFTLSNREGICDLLAKDIRNGIDNQ